MALKATVYKVELQVSDLDRGHYATHSLVLARHPSETKQRMMVRLLAFALHADPALQFGRGLCLEDEPDLWCPRADGETDLWLEVGLPDPRRLRKIAGRAGRVKVYAFGARTAALWWQKVQGDLARLANLEVWYLPSPVVDEFTALTRRTMSLQCSIHEGQVWLSDAEQHFFIEPQCWQGER